MRKFFRTCFQDRIKQLQLEQKRTLQSLCIYPKNSFIYEGARLGFAVGEFKIAFYETLLGYLGKAR